MKIEWLKYPLSNTETSATSEAVAFIEENALNAGVEEIVSKALEYLPAVAGIQLEVTKDPTCDCDPELAIRFLFEPTTAHDDIETALAKFDDKWWLDNSGRWDYLIEVHTGRAN